MIRIQKPASAPEKLLRDGKRKRRSHCSSYTRNPTAYQSGERNFDFDRTIYSDLSVKQALIAAQHKKCCFCERWIGIDGDVEHFRPKQAYQQANGQPLQRPGYYWLAYEWDNLYLACTGCNQRQKKNLFPLQNPGGRAVSHHHNLDDEQPLFIDPGKENPEEFIGFRGEVAYAIEGNARGQVTLKSLNLNQRELPESRLEHLQKLKILWKTVQLAKAGAGGDNPELQALAREAEAFLEKGLQDGAQFTAATRCAIATEFEFVIG